MGKNIIEFEENYYDSRTEATARTAEDFLELAEDADSKAQALKYAKMASRLDADNIDAKRMVEELSTEHAYELVKKYQKLIEQGKAIMAKKGYMKEEIIGEYWGILETRPFMRLYGGYVSLLVESGMMRLAAGACEEAIRYSENDNMGLRYTLMHIYAYLEDEKSMLKLHKKYGKQEETQLLLPLSILYYKLADWEKAEEYLDRLVKRNKDTQKFIHAVYSDTLDKYSSRMGSLGYQPFTIEEYIVELSENIYLFETVEGYFDWADQILSRKS